MKKNSNNDTDTERPQLTPVREKQVQENMIFPKNLETGANRCKCNMPAIEDCESASRKTV